jgi:hypothetical protein
MKVFQLAALALCTLAAPVLAQQQPAPPQRPTPPQERPPAATAGSEEMMRTMGPWTRRPTNEGQTKKDVKAFLNQEDALMQKRDFEGMMARIDFPIFMVTDDSQGVPMAKLYTRADYEKDMKPMWEAMPADIKMTHRPSITVLSDSLVSVADDFRMTMGGRTKSGRNHGLLVKRDGQWKWKEMAEAGWGDASKSGVGGSGPGSPQQNERPQGH